MCPVPGAHFHCVRSSSPVFRVHELQAHRSRRPPPPTLSAPPPHLRARVPPVVAEYEEEEQEVNGEERGVDKEQGKEGAGETRGQEDEGGYEVEEGVYRDCRDHCQGAPRVGGWSRPGSDNPADVRRTRGGRRSSRGEEKADANFYFSKKKRGNDAKTNRRLFGEGDRSTYFCLWCRPPPSIGGDRQRHCAAEWRNCTTASKNKNKNNDDETKNKAGSGNNTTNENNNATSNHHKYNRNSNIIDENSNKNDSNDNNNDISNNSNDENKNSNSSLNNDNNSSSDSNLDGDPCYDDEEDGGHENQEILTKYYREKPESYFCSWECARSWNARFSPAQARYERGLKIDVAAGRLVAYH